MSTTRLAAYALARDDSGSVLLVRIAPGYPAAGKWTLPGGGVRFGEDPADATIRELAEESGLDGIIRSLAFVHSGAGTNELGGPWHAVRIVYEVDVVGGELRDEVDESTDMAAWLLPDEARRLELVDLAIAALDHLERPRAD